MTIRVQFVCEHNIASQGIALFSAGHFSHCDCLLEDGTLFGARSDKVGGKPAGVQIRTPDYASFSSKVVFSLECTILQRESYHAFLASQEGMPYDKQAIWAFAFNRDWREKDSWICSELQAAALESADLTPPLYLAANKITPVALALALSALGATASGLARPAAA
jgi:hypothetical protein